MKTETANTIKNETQTFTMPPEVATSILSNPKNRLTGKQRRRAWAARERVLVSQQPILLHERGYHYAPDRSRTGAEKIARRLKGRKFRQLLIWEKRIAARIKVLEKIVATLTGVLETASADTLRARIAQMHAIGSLIQEELDTRG